ncbi:phage protease [Pseudomonas aeruginosa]|uniref:phage protease n=1 Tax=Pseudomonas aeruginosa TaxID=287 RepID=UPI000E06A65F|nr:phage protease [Pseudomonas aeruginosa]RCH24857.1 mu-like prophage I family protein [Pseudomonas aeruginosa]
MDELLKAIIEALSLKEGATEAEAIAALTALKPALDAQASSLATLRETLGLAKDASVEQIAAATSQLKKADPSQKPDPAKFVPLEAVTDLQEQIAALTARLNGGELDKLVGAALQDGRLLPSLEQWARDLGGKDIGQLKAYLDKAAPIAALTRLQGRQPEGDTHNLTDAEMEAARMTGISPADYAKAKGA